MGKKKSKQAGSTGAEGLTYMERRALGHGTRSERLGKDSLSNFYDCRLTLMPAVDPVVSPAGFLFSREAILKNLLEQKKAGKRALAEWEAAKEKVAAAREEARRAAAEAEARAFERAVNSGGGLGGGGVGGASAVGGAGSVAGNTNSDSSSSRHLIVGSSTIASNRERGAAVKAAWGTSAGAVAAADAAARAAEELRLARQAEEKPDTSSRCPAGGGKLRLKDLVSVRFYRLGDKDDGDGDEGDEREAEEARARRREADAAAALSAAGGNGYAFDPITRDPLTNATPIVVLLPSGCAMSEASYKTCVKPDGTWRGRKVEGIIKLQGGGTGFAAHDGKAAEAASHFALGAGSGRADVRGQLAAGGSRFGLKYAN